MEWQEGFNEESRGFRAGENLPVARRQVDEPREIVPPDDHFRKVEKPLEALYQGNHYHGSANVPQAIPPLRSFQVVH
jgi:hypothetical protein